MCSLRSQHGLREGPPLFRRSWRGFISFHGRWRGCRSGPGPQLGSGGWHGNATPASDSPLACPRCAAWAPPVHSSELPPPRKIEGTVIALFKSEGRMLPAPMQRSRWSLPVRSREPAVSGTALPSWRRKSGRWQPASEGTHAWEALRPDPLRRETHSSREPSRPSEVLEDKANTPLSRSGVSSLVIYLSSPHALATIIMRFSFQ